MYWNYGPGWGPMWGMGWIIPVLLIIGCVFLMRRMSRGSRKDRPLEILRERFAKGEITKEDFERMKKDLA